MKRFLGIVRGWVRKQLPANTYLNRLIWLSCICVAVPIVLAGSVYYHVSMTKLTAQFQQNNQDSLELFKDRVENILTNIEHESLQLASGPLVKNALDNPEYATAYFHQLDLLSMFQLHKNTNYLIQDIIFYDHKTAMALSHTYGLARLDGYYGKPDIEEAMGQSDPAAWMYLSDSSTKGYISYVRRLPVMSMGEPRGVLIIQINIRDLQNLLRSYTVSLDNQSIVLLDSNNRIIVQTEARPGEVRGEEREAVLESVKANEHHADYYLVEGKSGGQLVAFSRTAFGRTYLSVLPEQEMLAHLDWIRVLIVLSVSIFLLIGIVLTWITSRFAYNPIQKLLKFGEQLRESGKLAGHKGNEIEYIRSSLSYLFEQAESLNRYILDVKPDLRDRFLQKQLVAVGGGRKTQLLAEAATHQIATEGRYAVLIVKVENLLKETRFLPSEGPVIVFAVKNVMEELLEKVCQGQGYVVDKDDREAVALLRFAATASHAEIRAAISAYAEEVRSSLRQYLSFSASAGIGRLVEFSQLAESYKEAQLALQYRLFQDADRVLFYEDMIRIERNPVFMYPRAIEISMVDFLWSGDVAQAERELQEFARRIRSSDSYNTIFQCYQVLLSAIIQSLEDKGPGVLELLGDNLFDQLKENQTSQEVYDWFIGVLFPLYQEVSHEIRTKSTRLMIQRVCSHITGNPDSTHSLSECAELVDVSPSYLSRLFKKETGISFVEYVMNYKVEKAKDLLKNTDLPITEIAERVGYSERNLNRAFQRFVEKSPKQYRMSIR